MEGIKNNIEEGFITSDEVINYLRREFKIKDHFTDYLEILYTQAAKELEGKEADSENMKKLIAIQIKQKLNINKEFIFSNSFLLDTALKNEHLYEVLFSYIEERFE